MILGNDTSMLVSQVLEQAREQIQELTSSDCKVFVHFVLPAETKETIITDEEAMKVVQTVCDFYHRDVASVMSMSRRTAYVLCRSTAMKIMKHYRKYTPLERIGMLFSNRDHTTVLHNIGKLNDLCDTEEKLRNDTEKLIMLCEPIFSNTKSLNQ